MKVTDTTDRTLALDSMIAKARARRWPYQLVIFEGALTLANRSSVAAQQGYYIGQFSNVEANSTESEQDIRDADAEAAIRKNYATWQKSAAVQETAQAAARPHTYVGGARAEYTGRTQKMRGKTGYELEIMEGAFKGEVSFTYQPANEPEAQQELPCTLCHHVHDENIACEDAETERKATQQGKCPDEIECSRCALVFSPEVTDSCNCPDCGHDNTPEGAEPPARQAVITINLKRRNMYENGDDLASDLGELLTTDDAGTAEKVVTAVTLALKLSGADPYLFAKAETGS